MYICEITGRLSKPGVKLNKVIALTRPKSYWKFVKNEETREMERVQCSVGHEPVRELSVSQEGLDLWNSWSVDERNAFLASHKR